MVKKILIAVGAALVSTLVAAMPLELRSDHPQTYTVRRGDTLWDISGRFLTSPWRWPDLWHANPQVRNPHWIYPGDTLTLVYRNGQPTLELTSGLAHVSGRNYKLSPTMREEKNVKAIAPIPVDAIAPFLSRPIVVDAESYDRMPYIVASADDHLVNGVGGRVYVRGALDPNGKRYAIFRKGDALRKSKWSKKDDWQKFWSREKNRDNDIIGYVALNVGEAVRADRYTNDPAKFDLINSTREVLEGDRLLAIDGTDEFPRFVPHAPKNEVMGNIISAVDGVEEIYRHQVVVLNVGAVDGIEPGHVLAINQSGRLADDMVASERREKALDEPLKFQRSDTLPLDNLLEHIFNDVRNTKREFIDKKFGVKFYPNPMKVVLPAERAGELMVFRTFDKISYGLVMETYRPIKMWDRVSNPEYAY
jgi:hypothetical protein